ncbi:hypothetical protein LCGC14_1851080 [marine sediment metagenome]|uniref:Uncharacterized protein n=1 Tax=marine sediment metagenome TaxID=412755 RepID=A0A0F9GAQ9_9ZZZZ
MSNLVKENARIVAELENLRDEAFEIISHELEYYKQQLAIFNATSGGEELEGDELVKRIVTMTVWLERTGLRR